MKYLLVLIVVVFAMKFTGSLQAANPFLTEWNTPFGVPPFGEIELEHYLPAFEEAMQQHKQEISAIYKQRSAPTFDNTIAAMDRSGALLDRVSNVFFAMRSSMTNAQLEEIAKDVAPKLSKHQDEILLDDLLFQRVAAVYRDRDSLSLTPEQDRLLEETYKDFVRGGAELPAEKKERLKEINAELALLSLQFGENVLKETNKFELVVSDEADLAGLPAGAITAASETATERGHEGKWAFTLDKPSMIPLLQYAEKRALREEIYTAYINMGNHDDELDNKANLANIVALRRRARPAAGL